MALYNPLPPKVVGSLVTGTITTSSGEAVVDNLGAILPTLVTETSQGVAIAHLTVCAGGIDQSVPAGSVVTWSLIRP